MNYVPYIDGKFETASPESKGVSSRSILRFLQKLDELQVDIHSLYIFKDGAQLAGANRLPYRADTPRRIHSAAKALTGLAVLFAVDEGLVTLDTRLADIFPEDMPEEMNERQQKLTVRHLMTMTTGHAADTIRPLLSGNNSVRAFMEQPLEYEPGTYFLYNNGVPHVLGMIVEKVSGADYIEYLKPRFLEPLGIFCTVERTSRGELEGSQTMCTAEGFAKLALFYLQEGNWNGKQMISAELIREAGKRQVASGRCPSISFMHIDQFAGYGWQVWRNSTEGFRLDGGRSQFGFLFPEREIAIVCNAIEEDSGLIPTVLWETLYADIKDQDSKSLKADPEGEAALAEYLAKWNCAPKLAVMPHMMDDYYGRFYEMDENPYGIRKVRLLLTDGRPSLEMICRDRNYQLNIGTGGSWEENDAFLDLPRENERLNIIFGIDRPVYRVSGGWTSDFCFVFQVRQTNWMDWWTWYLRFNGDRLSLSVESNMEKMSHIRKRIPMRVWKYSDASIEGHRVPADK